MDKKKFSDEEIANEVNLIQKKLSHFDEINEPPISLSPAYIKNKIESGNDNRETGGKNKTTWKSALAMCISIVMLIGAALAAKVYVNNHNKLLNESDGSFSNSDTNFENNSEKNYLTFDSYDKLKKYLKKNVSNSYGIADGYLNGGQTMATGIDDSREEGVGSAESTTESSSTNVQVSGVDEADIVKNDGKHIFALKDNIVRIVEAAPADTMKVISKIEIDSAIMEKAAEMYLQNGRLIIIGQKASSASRNYYDDNLKISVLIYDVSAPQNPTKLRSFEQDGEYISSRLIENNVYLITKKIIYEEISNKDDPEKFVPQYSDNGKAFTIPVQDIAVYPRLNTTTYVVVSSVNYVDVDAGVSIKSFLGGGENIYANKESIYTAFINFESNEMETNIFKFSINNGEVLFDCSGTVPGNILNQFSMDEYKGNFRIATTSYVHGNTSNNLYILNSKLERIGKVEGLARGENIYSVRFMGNMGYMVTFKQVDPLFAVDLSDPTDPKVLGQLKIPGFSEYLHPLSDNLLIGFGKTANSDTGKVTGYKLSLFDVSDPQNPIELFETKIAQEDSYSEVSTNHKAFLFMKEKSLIGIPMIQYDTYGSIGTYMLFKVDGKNGFTKLGEIANKDIDIHGESGCRGVIIGEVIYVVSSNGVAASRLSDLSAISEIKF